MYGHSLSLLPCCATCGRPAVTTDDDGTPYCVPHHPLMSTKEPA